jgi:hypothetical protein
MKQENEFPTRIDNAMFKISVVRMTCADFDRCSCSRLVLFRRYFECRALGETGLVLLFISSSMNNNPKSYGLFAATPRVHW